MMAGDSDLLNDGVVVPPTLIRAKENSVSELRVSSGFEME